MSYVPAHRCAGLLNGSPFLRVVGRAAPIFPTAAATEGNVIAGQMGLQELGIDIMTLKVDTESDEFHIESFVKVSQ